MAPKPCWAVQHWDDGASPADDIFGLVKLTSIVMKENTKYPHYKSEHFLPTTTPRKFILSSCTFLLSLMFLTEKLCMLLKSLRHVFLFFRKKQKTHHTRPTKTKAAERGERASPRPHLRWTQPYMWPVRGAAPVHSSMGAQVQWFGLDELWLILYNVTLSLRITVDLYLLIITINLFLDT